MHLDEWLESSTRELAELARMADGTESALDELFRRGLDWLGRVAPYDVAVVFELVDGELRARAARGSLASPAVRSHRLRLEDFPSIRQAIEERRSRVYTHDDHAHGEGDPFDGVLDLPPGHACMVVPLVSGSDVFGIVSLDRHECQGYAASVVDLAEVFGRLLALSIHCVRQGERLARATLDVQERAQALERQAAVARESAGVLAHSAVREVRELARHAELVAATNSTVLVLGETGTGKERLAQFVHARSPRRQRPFVAVSVAALPSGTLESELFGHERGAFTGAVRARSGLFRAAHGGTLFLDEIAELPFDLQGKLLRVLQEGELMPVGAERSVRVDVRVIAATHVDLERAVAEGRFRQDLFYRLSVYPLRIPPLRERLADLPALCEVLLDELAPRVGRGRLEVTAAALEVLASLDYPGNIRELSNVLERAAIRAADGRIDAAELGVARATARTPMAQPVVGAAPTVELLPLAEAERRHILRVLAATGGRVYGAGGAAEILELPPTTLQSRMKKLGVGRAPSRASEPPPSPPPALRDR